MNDRSDTAGSKPDRRDLMKMLALAVAAAPGAVPAHEMKGGEHAMPAAEDHSKHFSIPGPKPTVVMLVHPEMVLLDLACPQTVLKMAQCDIHLVWKSRTPCMTDTGTTVMPTTTFAECPEKVDVLFVPGGIVGTTACINDPEVVDFIAEVGARAKYVTSVCTGSLLLGAAGLLKGYKATSLWAVAHLLPALGAIQTNERVVVDRNRITGAGVTAGLDFGLTLAAELRGEEIARRAQLIMEYAPAPPFHAGTPEGAGPEFLAKVKAARVGMDAGATTAVEKASIRLGIKT